MPRRTISIEGPLDLRGNLRPLNGSFADDGWWLPARTPVGASSLRLSKEADRVVGDAWGPGADWMLERLEGLIGMEDEPAGFAPPDPVVAELHRHNPGLRFGRTSLVFSALVAAVCAQKVTGREAHRAIRGLGLAFSDPAPGPNKRLRLPPDPVRMAAAPYHDYHGLHLEKRRADVLRRLAKEADSIDALAGTTPSVAGEALRRFSGVGEWTVAETLSISHGDPDQVPVGDFHIKHLVVHHLTGRDRGTDEEMLALLEPFRPHRGRVVRLLHRLGHAPKFGPRAKPRDITRW